MEAIMSMSTGHQPISQPRPTSRVLQQGFGPHHIAVIKRLHRD
jgi:hypothetical protein